MQCECSLFIPPSSYPTVAASASALVHYSRIYVRNGRLPAAAEKSRMAYWKSHAEGRDEEGRDAEGRLPSEMPGRTRSLDQGGEGIRDYVLWESGGQAKGVSTVRSGAPGSRIFCALRGCAPARRTGAVARDALQPEGPLHGAPARPPHEHRAVRAPRLQRSSLQLRSPTLRGTASPASAPAAPHAQGCDGRLQPQAQGEEMSSWPKP